jgi:hypothetical protein
MGLFVKLVQRSHVLNTSELTALVLTSPLMENLKRFNDLRDKKKHRKEVTMKPVVMFLVRYVLSPNLLSLPNLPARLQVRIY